MALEIWRRLLIDRIAITVKITSKDLYAFALDQLYFWAEEQSKDLPNGKIIIIKDKKSNSTRLEYCPEYHSKANNRRIADITMGANILFDKGSLHRYFKLTLYPSKFQASEFEHFKSMLGGLLPQFDYTGLYETGMVSYLELAADNLSHQHHGFLVYRKYVSKSDIYKDGEHLGTTYIGSESSGLRFRIYDKRKQLHEKGKPTFTKVLPHTRIEAAIRRLKLTPANLISMKNPFVKLSIADLDKAKAASSEVGWQQFLVECLTDGGVPRALAKRPSGIRKTYRARLDAIPVHWWKPESIWKDLPKALAVIAP